MTEKLILSVLIIQLAIQVWLLFGHKYKLGTNAGDQKKDRLFTYSRMQITFIYTVLLQAFLIYNQYKNQSLDIKIFIIGTVIFSIGVFIRVWAVKTLGRFFTFEIGIRKNHTFITDGPYKFIRHPSYTGYLLILLGIAISLNSILFFLLTFVGSTVFLLLRIYDEEKMLTNHFGKDYKTYKSKTKRLIPYIY